MGPTLREECHENFLAVWTGLEGTPGFVVDRYRGLTLVRTGVSFGPFNPVIALDRPETLDGVAERIRRLMVDRSTPWVLVTTADSAPALAPLIDEFHLGRRRTSPGMVLELAPSPSPSYPSDLDIHAVTEPEEVRVFWRVATEGLEVPRGLLDPWMNALEGVTRQRARAMGCYLGYAAGLPVATSMRIVTGRVAGVYWVTTLKDVRRRGYGTAMTWRAALEGARVGCTKSYLSASAMGFPVYEKMGYRTFEEYQYWASAPAPKDSPSKSS